MYKYLSPLQLLFLFVSFNNIIKAYDKLYKRGFIYSKKELSIIPSNFHKIMPNLHIDKNIEYSISPNKSICIFGLACDVRNPNSNINSIANNLEQSLAISELKFHEEEDFICGRYTIMYNLNNNTKIISDATGMRAIFYTKDNSIISSHAKLAYDNLQILNKNHIKMNPPITSSFGGGYFGYKTPYKDIYLLTPNTSLSIKTGAVQRFYPRKNLKSSSIKDSSIKISNWVKNAINNIAKKKSIILGLTAGIDSRATLSLMHKLFDKYNIKIFSYTDGEKPTVKDDFLAKQICNKINIPHHTIKYKKISIDKETKFILDSNGYHGHNTSAILHSLNYFNDESIIHIRSNLLEIGRAFFFYRKPGPITKQWLYNMFLGQNPKEKKIIIQKIKFKLIKALEKYSIKTNFNDKAIFNYDPRDLYYWEQRMGTWHSQILLRWDYAFETFIPWNARCIFTAMLEIPFLKRKSGALLKEIINKECPILIDIPINPQITRIR